MSADVVYLLAGIALLLAVVLPTALRKAAISAPIVLLVVGAVIGLLPLPEGVDVTPMSNRAFLAILAAVAFVALLGYGLIAKDGTRAAIGEPFPDAPVERLGGGGEVSVADHRGKWVLVNLWASWCEPCRQEAPALERFARRHADDLVVLGIATEDLTGDAQAFAEEFGITYELLHDGAGKRKDELGATGLPETFLIDPEGNLAAESVGAVDDAYLDRYYAPLIEGEAS